MKTFFPDSLMSLITLARQDYTNEFTNHVNDMNVILPDLSFSGYAIPLEGALMAIVIFLLPVIILILNRDNKSGMSHTESGADRLELRTDIGRIKTDIHSMIHSRMAADNVTDTTNTEVKEEEKGTFINRVTEILDKNLTTQGYTIDTLCADMGMCRTGFYNKMKEMTGKTPVEYIFEYKMEKAAILLASMKYSVAEVADALGYCDAKYFGRKFKSFYHVCPTEYIKSFEP